MSTAAESQLQAYSAFVSGFKNKLSYFMRIIPDVSNLLLPIEDTIPDRFTAAITGVRRIVSTLSTRYGGLTIPIFHEKAEFECNNSRRIATTKLTSLITVQQMEYTVEELVTK